jgi:hypothetical protein
MEAVPDGELEAQMRLLLPFEAAFHEALLPALLRQIEAGATALEEYPQDDAHMRARVVLHRLGSGWIAPHLERVALAFGARTLRALGASDSKAAGTEQDPIFGAAPGFRLLMRAWAQEHAAALVVDIDEATVAKLREAVDSGLARSEGQRPVARRIVDHISGIGGLTAKARSQVIARTETHNAATYGAEEAARSSELAYRRQWISAGDARTRADHAAAHGQTRGPNESFLVGGESMPRPGVGSARNVVNCRCVLRYLPQTFRRWAD